MQLGMRFASGITTDDSLERAVPDLLRQIQAQLGSDPGSTGIDLALFFISAQLVEVAPEFAERLRAELNPRVLLGCTAEGVIGREREIEEGPAVALVVAQLPGVTLTPIYLQLGEFDWHKLLLDQEDFQRLVDAPEDTRLFILLGDPFSTPMDDVLESFNACFPGIPVIGGMASGALRPLGNTLILDDRITHEGIIGLTLSGALEVDVVLSQGCRPIWRPFKVGKAHRNVILNLEGRPPLVWLQDLIPELPEEDRLLLQKGLFVGRAIEPARETLGRGDFLIRGVMGIDQQSGAIAIADSVIEGETIQFHLRDALTAQEDLEMMLIPQMFRDPPKGGLLFSCNGRGTRLYDHPDGDISVIQRSLENIHLAGFFCAGEIGPIGGANFLHGHTASLVLFRPLTFWTSPDSTA